MNFIRVLFTTALAVGLTLLAIANWVPVRVNIGFGLVLDTHLPVLVAGLLLAVGLPMWAFSAASRALLERRVTKLQAALETSEAALAQARVELLRPANAAPVRAEASAARVPVDTAAASERAAAALKASEASAQGWPGGSSSP